VDGDPTLISRSLTGDKAARDALVDRYGRLVYSVPKSYRLPPEACDDIFQDVFLSLFRNLASIRDQAALPKWLITTAHRESWKWARSKPREATVEVHDAIASPDPAPDLVEKRELEHKLHQALRRLGGRCEELLKAIFLDRSKPSYTAISERLSIPVGSIGPTRIRCLAKLLELAPDLEQSA
jgi:RNA polymerase sigma factor (sigma-70 family)